MNNEERYKMALEAILSITDTYSGSCLQKASDACRIAKVALKPKASIE